MNINIVLIASVLFFLSEFTLMIAKRSKKARTKESKDKKSLVLFWISIPLAISIGFFAANYHSWNSANKTVAIVGLSIFIVGILIRWISILGLNKEFTVDVTITENHTLKTDGIYRNIRHPSYLGLLLECFGLSIAMNSAISLLVVSIPILLVILYRIRIEENILIEEFGDAYKNYMKVSNQLIPKVFQQYIYKSKKS